MNLSMLDREQLERLLLDPPGDPTEVPRCSENFTIEYPPGDVSDRSVRIRHVLAAAHELLVRIANTALVGRSLLNQPALVKDYLKVYFAGAERETFVVIFLDAQMRVIAAEELFAGTLTQTAVYPREVVKRALHHNAGSILCAHPHLSGRPEPSHADQALTKSLASALTLVDIRLVDHFMVAGSTCVSFAESGRL